MQLSIEDRLALQDVIILYGHLHDSHRWHRIADEIFTADAEIDFGTGRSSPMSMEPSLRPADSFVVGGYQNDLRRQADGWRILRHRVIQYGTGLGVGVIAPKLHPMFEGAVGLRADWP